MYCIVVLQKVSVLCPRKMEMEEPIVKDFMETDEFRYYVDDWEVMYCGFFSLNKYKCRGHDSIYAIGHTQCTTKSVIFY